MHAPVGKPGCSHGAPQAMTAEGRLRLKRVSMRFLVVGDTKRYRPSRWEVKAE
ncbi:hypothetical protein AWB74_07490 [Caballeronia arvi]|uniref:Uncharacterized protein n=1 Tax=Caballeronia arvi TaxID=1777135 RepID=A0A158KYU3_9BURK|nr:hypothetical protein AWB74_07490 [Caballeronia arvi]